MIRREFSDISTADKKHRHSFSSIEKFIADKVSKDGKILILYGLRRTGKTTLMEQAVKSLSSAKECAFYEIEEKDTLMDVKQMIISERKKGVNLICIDEITKAKDFITDSATLSDVFAKEGMNIIVTGTDSLGFVFAENDELYDRTVRIKTTHIPFAEHCEVLGTKDIDDYIQYGGLMRKGKEENDRIIYDYESACKYLDSSVAENISRSIRKSSNNNCLEELTITELKTIIKKMVEKYSGKFNKRLMQEKLTSASIGYTERLYEDILDSDVIENLVLEKQNIIKDFIKEINADSEIHHQITDEMVNQLEQYLTDMDLLSATIQIDFRYSDLGWKEDKAKHEYYIIQPAIKYHHLQKAKEFIENEDYYKELSQNQKEYLKNKLDEKIKGDMTEQIVLFDVAKDLSLSHYSVCKPVFYIDGMKKGEYDMLIYDKSDNKYWGFEIKHTSEPFYLQQQHLINRQFQEIIDYKYGKRENVCVLYRGKPFVSDDGVSYFNITDFLIAVNKFHDMDKVFSELEKSLELKVLSQKENSGYKCNLRKTQNR